MIRTVISLEPNEKQWLDAMAKKNHMSMAALIRKAITTLRLQDEHPLPSDADSLLSKTKGIWTRQDGLDYQLNIRREGSQQTFM